LFVVACQFFCSFPNFRQSSHLQVIQPEEEAAGDALASLEGFDDEAPSALPARPTLREAPEAVRAALLVELANRLCWYSRLKVGRAPQLEVYKAIHGYPHISIYKL
jgi:hypothetical protein